MNHSSILQFSLYQVYSIHSIDISIDIPFVNGSLTYDGYLFTNLFSSFIISDDSNILIIVSYSLF